MTDFADREPRLRHLLIGLAGALVAGVLVVSGIGRLAGYADLGRAVRGADVWWLTICAAGQVVVFAGYAGAMRRAMSFEGGVDMPVALSLRLALAGFAATQLFAFAGAAGLAIMWWALRRLGMHSDEAAVRLIALSTSVYFVFACGGWVAAVWVLAGGGASLAVTVPWIVAVPVVVAAARWFTAPSRVQRWSATGPGLRRRALATGVAAAWQVRRSLVSPAGRRVFGWAAVYWIGDLASLWAALRAFGSTPPVATLALVYATGYLVQSLPIPLIATGGVDAATTFLLRSVGVPLDVALVAVVTHRVFAFWLPVAPGSVFALLLPRTTRPATD